MKIIHDITNFIFIKDEIQKADIIFIPGGSYPELGEYAAELWKQDFAPLVMPSGGVSLKTGKFNGVKSKKELYNKEYKTDCEFLLDVLMINGVPARSIIWENTSSCTKENAFFSRDVAIRNKLDIKTAILCCKNFHARRSLMSYQFAFPETKFYIHPIPYYEGDTFVTKENWHETEIGIRRVMGELERCGNQFLNDLNCMK